MSLWMFNFLDSSATLGMTGFSLVMTGASLGMTLEIKYSMR